MFVQPFYIVRSQRTASNRISCSILAWYSFLGQSHRCKKTESLALGQTVSFLGLKLYIRHFVVKGHSFYEDDSKDVCLLTKARSTKLFISYCPQAFYLMLSFLRRFLKTKWGLLSV